MERVNSSGELLFANQNKSCGDGSAKQAYLKCNKGECKRPDCEASNAKNTIEAGAPDFVLNALKGGQRVLNESKVFYPDLNQEISISAEM